MELKKKLYYKMKLIRETENEIERLFSKGMLRGTTHGSKGQEAVPAALLDYINPDIDYVCGGHRSHGHLLALSGDVRSLIAELMTKQTGYVQGKGGSQHMQYKNFFCNGITGGMVPVAIGLAFAQKKRLKKGISVVFFGDGAMNEGYVLEAFNLAAVYDLPILFVLENNSYAMSTSVTESTAGNFKDRIKGFGIFYHFLEATDVIAIHNLAKEVINEIRMEGKPQFIEFKTHRFSGHSKSDDRCYIPEELDSYWKQNDPLEKIGNDLDSECKKRIDEIVKKEIQKAVETASNDPYPVI